MMEWIAGIVALVIFVALALCALFEDDERGWKK